MDCRCSIKNRPSFHVKRKRVLTIAGRWKVVEEQTSRSTDVIGGHEPLITCFSWPCHPISERSFWRVSQKKKDRAGTVFEDGFGVRRRGLVWPCCFQASFFLAL